jgi:hypothetical protein
MLYAVEMDSGAMIYIPSFIKIGSGIQKTHRQRGDLTSLLLFFIFFKIRKEGYKFKSNK